MLDSKEVNELAKAYMKKLNLPALTKKHGRRRVIQKAYYHGYFEALRQIGALPDYKEEKIL